MRETLEAIREYANEETRGRLDVLDIENWTLCRHEINGKEISARSQGLNSVLDYSGLLKRKNAMPKILPGQTDLYALTDSRLSRGRPLEEVADKLLSSGIHILQYREKRLPAGKMLEECRMLRK